MDVAFKAGHAETRGHADKMPNSRGGRLPTKKGPPAYLNRTCQTESGQLAKQRLLKIVVFACVREV